MNFHRYQGFQNKINYLVHHDLFSVSMKGNFFVCINSGVDTYCVLIVLPNI